MLLFPFYPLFLPFILCVGNLSFRTWVVCVISSVPMRQGVIIDRHGALKIFNVIIYLLLKHDRQLVTSKLPVKSFVWQGPKDEVIQTKRNSILGPISCFHFKQDLVVVWLSGHARTTRNKKPCTCYKRKMLFNFSEKWCQQHPRFDHVSHFHFVCHSNVENEHTRGHPEMSSSFFLPHPPRNFGFVCQEK